MSTTETARQSYWREEPARLSGQVAALLGLLAAAGLQLSDDTTAAITSAAAGVAALAGAWFLRSKVSSTATTDRATTQIAALTTTPFDGAGVAGYGNPAAFTQPAAAAEPAPPAGLDPDAALLAAVAAWAAAGHSGANADAAAAVLNWAKTKSLTLPEPEVPAPV